MFKSRFRTIGVVLGVLLGFSSAIAGTAYCRVYVIAGATGVCRYDSGYVAASPQDGSCEEPDGAAFAHSGTDNLTAWATGLAASLPRTSAMCTITGHRPGTDPLLSVWVWWSHSVSGTGQNYFEFSGGNYTVVRRARFSGSQMDCSSNVDGDNRCSGEIGFTVVANEDVLPGVDGVWLSIGDDSTKSGVAGSAYFRGGMSYGHHPDWRCIRIDCGQGRYYEALPDYDEDASCPDNCQDTYNPSQTDSDGDGQGDDCDSAPGDPLVYDTLPAETALLELLPDTTTLTWLSGIPQSGTGTLYDVLAGQIGEWGGGPPSTCLANGLSSNTTSDPAIPPSGHGFWYLVRARNSKGSGPWGYSSEHQETISGFCR
jgi:hypothetical protein